MVLKFHRPKQKSDGKNKLLFLCHPSILLVDDECWHKHNRMESTSVINWPHSTMPFGSCVSMLQWVLLLCACCTHICPARSSGIKGDWATVLFVSTFLFPLNPNVLFVLLYNKCFIFPWRCTQQRCSPADSRTQRVASSGCHGAEAHLFTTPGTRRGFFNMDRSEQSHDAWEISHSPFPHASSRPVVSWEKVGEGHAATEKLHSGASISSHPKWWASDTSATEQTVIAKERTKVNLW